VVVVHGIAKFMAGGGVHDARLPAAAGATGHALEDLFAFERYTEDRRYGVHVLCKAG
jgi:hypothetical protein